MYNVVRIDRQKAEAVEALGTKRKFWLGDHRVLFKAEERGTGEDWAEKIACELCELLGLPHVHYDLAEEYDGNEYHGPGVICETCSPPPLELVLGNRLLQDHDPSYPAEVKRKYKVREHTAEVVAEVVSKLAPPALEWMVDAPAGIATALDTFVGYVMLDAWVANQDRHHHNWAALQGDGLRLAPTFDHGASLARNISDEERKARLETQDANYTVRRFAEKARSAFYGTAADERSLTTIDAFTAFARLSPVAARLWLERLAAVQGNAVESILREIPPMRMSSVTREFTLQLMLVNQERLLQEKI